MEMRSSGRMERIGFVLLAFALAFLACGAAYASDVERQIPMTRDAAGSGLTTEISLEGTRSTATPFLTLYNPTVQGIEDRIARKIGQLASKEIPSEATAGSLPRIGLTGSSTEDSGRQETTLSSLPPVPTEITVRTVKGFLKGLRSSRKEKQTPSVVVAAPELRLGMADTSQR
ncbi:MAG: hypothetical protein PHP88_10560 [bacterium]|nr:hypothetical protein [bacterium]